MANNSLRFEEFTALRKRQGTASTGNGAAAAAAAAAAEAEASPSFTPTLNASNAGRFFESFEMQLLTLSLIAFDVAAAVTTTLLTCGGYPESALARAALNVLESFTGFTLFFFILELAALCVAFRMSFFTHIGNLTDTAVVFTCLVWEIQGESRGIRVLGVFRAWRVLRLMGTMLAAKDRALDLATDAWQADQQRLQETRLEVARLGDALRREADSKKRVETMLKSYKDEIETLNEALKIAALDIASAAGDQLLSDDDSDEDGSTVARQAAAAPVKPTRTVFVNADGSYSVQST